MHEEHQSLVEQILLREAELHGERRIWDAHWQNIADYVMPRKAEISATGGVPGTAREQLLFDSTAIRANMVLANGQLANMTPLEGRWFSFDPPPYLKGVDAVEQYYRQCTEAAQAELARSNFYSEIHELYLDRGGFGTAAIFCEEGVRQPLNFRKLDVGTFSISEDSEGYVDTLSREFELTAVQAAEKFGEENLSEKMRKALADPRRRNQRCKFVHQIYPRRDSERDRTKRDGRNKPVASVYLDRASRHIVRVAGYDEQPFFCTRYLKWTTNSPYGWSPSLMALPDIKQLNFLEMNLDALAELAAFPRFLVPDTHEGDVDFRAHGVTYFDANSPAGAPREWATGGRYDIGLQRAEKKREAIEKAFHVDLFQMFAQIEKVMTAREVAERAGEKLIQFSPTFARMTTELFTPLLRRVFSVLSRAGRFPAPPQEVVQVEGAEAFVPEPELSYSSRIALAIKALENTSFARTMDFVLPLVNVSPNIMDNFDLDTVVRDMSRNEGLPSRWMLALDAMKGIREQRSQAEAQNAQAQQAAMMASAAKDAGSVQPESVLGQALAGGN